MMTRRALAFRIEAVVSGACDLRSGDIYQWIEEAAAMIDSPDAPYMSRVIHALCRAGCTRGANRWANLQDAVIALRRE